MPQIENRLWVVLALNSPGLLAQGVLDPDNFLAHLALAKWPGDVVPWEAVLTRPRVSRDSREPGFFISRWLRFFIEFLMLLGAILVPILTLCWKFFRSFFALKMRSYLEVVLASIFHRFWSPLDPRKLSPRQHENQFIDFLTVLS